MVEDNPRVLPVLSSLARAGVPPLDLTWARRLCARDGRDYDAFVESAPAGHFAQARHWSPVARAGRPFASSYLVVRGGAGPIIGAAHLLRGRIAGIPLPHAVIERGPVVADPALFGPILQRIARAARWRGIARLSVMPYWEVGAGAAVREALDRLGWRSAQVVTGAHAATLRLALAGRQGDALFDGPDLKKLRQEIRYAERAGARGRRGGVEDLPQFIELYRGLMAEQRLHAKSDAWFRALAALDFGPMGPGGLFFTEHEGETLAGALTLRHGRRVTLYLAASARAQRKFAKMVPALVAAIDWARALGCDFDLGGVPMAEDTDEKRLSIAQFKRDFSKNRVELIGEHRAWLIRP